MPAAPTPRAPRVGDGLRWSDVERALQRAHGPLLAAVDEVGRGPLAGPVVVCALVMPADAPEVPGVDDSKRLAPPARVGAPRRHYACCEDSPAPPPVAAPATPAPRGAVVAAPLAGRTTLRSRMRAALPVTLRR